MPEIEDRNDRRVVSGSVPIFQYGIGKVGALTNVATLLSGSSEVTLAQVQLLTSAVIVVISQRQVLEYHLEFNWWDPRLRA